MKTTRKQVKFPEEIIKTLDKKVLKVGWVTRKQYLDSKMTTAGVGYLAENGSGDGRIPARPIMRPTNEEKKSYWRRVATIEAKKVLSGKQTVIGQLDVLGNLIAGAYRKKITEISTPPLKESTVLNRMYKKNKGIKNKITKAQITDSFRKPLVFTKFFLNSCTYSIEDKNS